MLLTPPSLRSKVSEQPDWLRISIPGPRSASTALFPLFWLVMWGYAEKRVGTSIISGKQQNLFDIAWFGFWTFGGGCVMYAWFWNLFGRDIVTVGAGELRLRSEIAGVGRDRRFQIDDIHNLRFIPEYGAGRGHREAQIAFDFGAKTIKFAGSIEDLRLLCSHPGVLGIWVKNHLLVSNAAHSRMRLVILWRYRSQ